MEGDAQSHEPSLLQSCPSTCLISQAVMLSRPPGQPLVRNSSAEIDTIGGRLHRAQTKKQGPLQRESCPPIAASCSRNENTPGRSGFQVAESPSPNDAHLGMQLHHQHTKSSGVDEMHYELYHAITAVPLKMYDKRKNKGDNPGRTITSIVNNLPEVELKL